MYNFLHMKTGKHTVLIVEDEATMANTMSDALTNEGFETFIAVDGEQGLKMALEKHPDLILTDLNMPNMDGLAMIHGIRKDDWGKDVEIISLTNVSDVAALETAMSEGTFYYMVKSDVSLADIVTKVKSRLLK